MVKILIIDDEETICKSLKWTLENLGHEITYALNYEDGKKLILEQNFLLYFVDLILPGGSGIDLIRLIREKSSNGIIIIITGYPNIPTLVDAVNQEVFDYLNKPITRKRVIEIVNHALEFNEKIKVN
ncbi:MAG: response regulator [Candidatus Lokiarchaeota archaeon]|nr:response regulator [Candidatus Lokiarchaeota archaeon]